MTEDRNPDERYPDDKRPEGATSVLPDLPDGLCHWVLMTRAQIDGAVRDAGYVFVRPDDWVAGGTTVRGDGPVGSPEQFKLEPLAIKHADLPKPAPSDSAGDAPPPEAAKPISVLPVTDEHLIRHDVAPEPRFEEPLLGTTLPPATPDPNAPKVL